MIRRWTLAVLTCCLVMSRADAAQLEDLERQIRDVVAQRQAAEQERSAVMLAAAAAADEIGKAQPPPGARATSALERQLREFDRLVGRLDSTDRALRNLDTTIAGLRRAFSTELDRLTRDLSALETRSSAARAAELDAARRRVDAVIAPPTGFRPLLVVRPAATDTVADLDQKLAILDVEATRGTEALRAFDQELVVLGGRTVVTRRLLDDLERTARAAPPDLRLVQRQVDEVQARLRDMAVKEADLRRNRASVVTALAELGQQVRECRARRAALIKG